MSAYKALLAYEELLREFNRRMTRSSSDCEETLERGLSYLSKRLNLDNVGIFCWDSLTHSFHLEFQYHGGTLMAGEEEIAVGPNHPLKPMVDLISPIVVSAKKPWVAFVPMVYKGSVIGAIRIRRTRPLPRGRVLLNLPRFHSYRVETLREFPLLNDLRDILSAKLGDVLQEKRQEKKAQCLAAQTEVAAAVVETPRLKEMLETVSQSVVKNLGFDRVRFYLVDSVRFELCGVLGLQIPARRLALEEERYPLKAGISLLVDIIVAGRMDVVVDKTHKNIAYIPLVSGQQVIGCMTVDNLLSQQDIVEEELEALKTVGRYIGMAILNARLFEDIEQQAITDGLTKLYVYRYFQQRLKEEIDRADRYSYSVALIMMDLDNFKSLNDNFGHPMGDKVLEVLAQEIRANIRRIDLAARYGGDEFALVLPEISEKEAWLMGSRLLNAIKQSSIKSSGGETLKIDVTMGIAMYSADARNGRDLIEAADKALYWAKKNTRGDICFYRNVSGKVEKTA